MNLEFNYIFTLIFHLILFSSLLSWFPLLQIILTTNYIYIYFSRLFFRKKKENFPRSIPHLRVYDLRSHRRSLPSGHLKAAAHRRLHRLQGTDWKPTVSSSLPHVNSPANPSWSNDHPPFIHFYTFENLLWECSTCNYYAVVATSIPLPLPPIP